MYARAYLRVGQGSGKEQDTLELRIERSNCVRFEARGLQEGAVTIRDLVRHALRHRPDRQLRHARRRGASLGSHL